MGGEGKGRRGVGKDGKGRGGKVDSDALLEQRRRLAKASPEWSDFIDSMQKRPIFHSSLLTIKSSQWCSQALKSGWAQGVWRTEFGRL